MRNDEAEQSITEFNYTNESYTLTVKLNEQGNLDVDIENTHTQDDYYYQINDDTIGTIRFLFDSPKDILVYLKQRETAKTQWLKIYNPAKVEMIFEYSLGAQTKRSVLKFEAEWIQMSQIQLLTKRVKKGQKRIEQLEAQLANNNKSLVKAQSSVAWSRELKDESANIYGLYLQGDIPTYRYILMDAPLSKEKRTRWKIEILDKNWIGIGIALKKVVINKNYRWQNYTSLGHGSYICAYHKYTWSHTEADFNHQTKSHMTYGQGDTFISEYIPSEKKIRFNKHGEPNYYSLNIPLLENDEYYACVVLGGKTLIKLVSYEELF